MPPSRTKLVMAMNLIFGNGHRELLNGGAPRLARADLAEMAIAIATAPVSLVDETVRLWAGRVGDMVRYGVIEHSEGIDALREACVSRGLAQERGEDGVQELLGDAIGARPWSTEEEASEELVRGFDAQTTGGPYKGNDEVGHPGKGGEIVYECAAKIAPEPVQWIWPGRIPRGKLTLLGGDPDQGKTLTALTIGATITQGGKWPDGSSAEVGNIVILSAEDDAADTIIPRLMAAGADKSKVFIIESVRERVADDRGDVRRIFSLERDLKALEAMLGEIGGASLVTIDVIDSYMGGTDTHRNAAVRGVLAPIKDFAARCHVAVLALTHFSKDQSNKSPVLRFTGSIGFIGQARAGWVVTPEMDDESEPTGRKLLVRAKGNLSPDPGGLAYRIETTTIGDGIVAPRIVWDGEVSLNAAQALAPPDDDKRPREEAVEWLTGYLGDCARPSADAIKEASKVGIKERTLERARRQLGVVAWFRKHTNHWVMALPEVAERMQEADRPLEGGQAATSATGNV